MGWKGREGIEVLFWCTDISVIQTGNERLRSGLQETPEGDILV